MDRATHTLLHDPHERTVSTSALPVSAIAIHLVITGELIARAQSLPNPSEVTSYE
jgi:hypothetical protein